MCDILKDRKTFELDMYICTCCTRYVHTGCPRMSVPKVNLNNFGSTLSISVL